jgi:hypothetical protein
MVLEITVVLLAVVIVIQAIINRCERRDMLNRLMSKSLTDYKQGGMPPKAIPSAHDRVLKNWRNKAGDK